MSEPDYYSEANVRPGSQEVMSPSGRFRLLIRQYATREGCWDYSRGTVYRVPDGKLITDIKRNFSTFHHSWIEKDGEEYLVSGRSYMNQCIVNLDQGLEMEARDEVLEERGVAFCWAAVWCNPDGNTLVVDGCQWAGPYEYRFFDFTDPTKGWPELPIRGEADCERDMGHLGPASQPVLYCGEEEPEFADDGAITLYSTTAVFIPTGQRDDEITSEQVDELGDAYDDEANWREDVMVRYTLRRRGDVVLIEDVWRPD